MCLSNLICYKKGCPIPLYTDIHPYTRIHVLEPNCAIFQHIWTSTKTPLKELCQSHSADLMWKQQEGWFSNPITVFKVVIWYPCITWHRDGTGMLHLVWLIDRFPYISETHVSIYLYGFLSYECIAFDRYMSNCSSWSVALSIC